MYEENTEETVNYNYTNRIQIISDYLKDVYNKSMENIEWKYDRCMETAVGIVLNTLHYFIKNENKKYQHKNHYEIDRILNADSTIINFLDMLSFSIEYFHIAISEHYYIDKNHAHIVQKRMRYLLGELRQLMKEQSSSD